LASNLVAIFSWLAFISASRHAIICPVVCSISVVWRINLQSNNRSIPSHSWHKNVTYLGFVWLIRQVLDLLIRFIGPLYSWLQKFINDCRRLLTGHSIGSILTSNWTLDSFHSESDLILFCTTYTVLRQTHRKHCFLYCCIYSTTA
jgi:hypothetical protein